MKKLSVLILALLSLALLASCAMVEKESSQSDRFSLQTAFSDKERTLSEPVPVPKNGQISPEEAKDAAFKHANVNAGEAYKIEVELDKDDRVPHYDISFKIGNTKYEYEIHAQTAEFLEREQAIKKERGAVNTPAISQDQAKGTALAHAGVQESTIWGLKIELDKENAKVVYEIEFHSGAYEYDYEIDAQSGAILKFERDR